MALGLVLFVGVGLRMFFSFQAGRGAGHMDREEAALLRTAVDALGMLIKRRLKRLKPVPRRL